MDEQPKRTEFEKLVGQLHYEDYRDALRIAMLSLRDRLLEEGRKTDAALLGVIDNMERDRDDLKEWLEDKSDVITDLRRKLRAKNAEIRALKAGKR